MTAGLGEPQVPAGLPDEATLTRMAAEFFGAQGGSHPAAPSARPTGGGTSSVPSGALPPGTVSSEAPSERSGLGTSSTPAALGQPTGGASTTGAAQYADTPVGLGEYTPTWLRDADGSPSDAPSQYGAAPSGANAPSGATRIVPPGLPEVPGLEALAALGASALGHSTQPHSPLDHGPQNFLPAWLSPFAETAVVVPALPPVVGFLPPAALAAPGLPGAPPVSAPSTPYWLLGESSGYPSAGGVPMHSVRERPAGGRPVPASSASAFDVDVVRRDFPILSETVNGRPLVWFDNAATTQKPQAVIDRLAYFYAHENSNIHRAAHELAARSTDAYEGARDKVARFLGAGSSSEIVFVRGATEAINLVAAGWGRRHVRSGDEIVISHLEHHANIVPWQELCKQTGAVLKVIPVDSDGQILLQDYTDLLSDRTKLVAITQVSNALGTVVPVKQVADLAHRAGARVLIDGAQSVPHLRVDVQDLGADFFVFSGHKIFAPTGIGALYGREEVLEDMGPYQTGGNMIRDVTLERSLFNPAPMKFEAGTGNIADAVGLGAALDYLERIGFEAAAAYEHELLRYGMSALREVDGLHLIGTAADKASVMSFVLDGYTPEQVGNALNREGIAVRSGHHCAQPILRRFGLEATVRPSLAFYNTCGEIDHLVATLHRLAADGGGATRGRSTRSSDPAP